MAKNQGLSSALEQRRLDIVEVLVSCGADIRSVDFADVLCEWDPEIIQFFLEHGADVVTGAPFAIAFGQKVRTTLRPFLNYKEAHPELAMALQEQVDRALRHFCYEGDLKWVNLLLWAGADPRIPGPTLDDRWEDDP